MLSISVVYSILFIGIIFLIYSIYSAVKRSWKSNSKGINPFTVLLNFKNLVGLMQRYVKSTKIRKGFYHLWFGPRFMMLAVDPDTAQFVLKHPEIEKSSNLNNLLIKENFGNHVARANGEDWKQQRRVVNFGFMKDAYLGYYPTFLEMTEKLMKKWEDLPPKEDIDASVWFSRFTIDLLGKSIFHYDFQNLDSTVNTYYEAYKTIVAQGGSTHRVLTTLCPYVDYLPLPTTLNMKRSINHLISLFHKIIESHKSGEKFDDILDHLLEAVDPNDKKSNSRLISNIYAFFLAGHETTAAALDWAVVELANKQDIQEKLYQEIVAKYGTTNPPSFEDVYSNYPEYLQCFINENLRLHTPAPFLPTRVALSDIQVGDQVIPKGSAVGIDILSIHKNPDFWEEPEKFDPERFRADKRKGRHKFSFLPFSLGLRQCLGNEFSEIEQRLLLVRLLQKFKILPPKDHPQKDLQSNELMFFNAIPFYISLQKR